MASRTLKVEILGDASSLNRAFGQVGNSSSKLGRSFAALGKIATVGVGAAFVGLAATLKVGFGELAEGQKVAAQTGAVLKSTGGIANVTAKEVDTLSQSLSRMSGVDDEVIGAGENLLLTFTKVHNEAGRGNDIFDQATKTALDMSVALGKDLNSSVLMVGKALQDPVKGLTALGRAGVDVRGELSKTVAAFVKVGDTVGAQKAILAELTTEFGGSAKAFGETMPGQLAKLKNAFEEMAGSIAETLLPHLQALVDWATTHMPQIQATIEGAIKGIQTAIEILVPVVQTLIGVFQAVWEKAQSVWPSIAATVVGALKGIDQQSNVTKMGMGDFQKQHGIVWTTIQKQQATFKAWLQTDLAPAIKNFTSGIEFIWKHFGNTITTVAKNAFGLLKAIILTPLNDILSVFKITLAVLRGDWSQAWDEMKAIVVRKIDLIKKVLTAFPTAIVALFKDAKTWLSSIGSDIIAGLWTGMKSKWQDVKEWLGGLGGAIKGLKGPPAKDAVLLTEIGRLVMQGFHSGLKDGWDNAVKPLLEKLSPDIKTKVSAAIDGAIQAVQAKQGAFTTAFDGLVSAALAAFDKLTEGMKTAGERALVAFDLKQAKAAALKQINDLKDSVTAALSELAAVQGRGPETVTRNEGEKDDAFRERQLEAEKKFLADVQAAQATAASANLALQAEKDAQALAAKRASLEKQAAQERKDLDDRRERQRLSLDARLSDLQNSFLQGEITVTQFTARMAKILDKAGIPLKNAATQLGAALAAGLNEAKKDAVNAAKELAQAIINQLGNISVSVRVHISSSRSGADDDKRASGGPVKRGKQYLVGEQGPELFVPSASGKIVSNANLAAGGGRAMGGGGSMVFNFPNYVGDRRELEDAMQSIMLTYQRRNGFGFAG